MRPEKCDGAALVDTMKYTGWMRRGCMANDRLTQRSDYNVSGPDTSGYVTAGNSRVVSSIGIL